MTIEEMGRDKHYETHLKEKLEYDFLWRNTFMQRKSWSVFKIIHAEKVVYGKNIGSVLGVLTVKLHMGVEIPTRVDEEINTSRITNDELKNSHYRDNIIAESFLIGRRIWQLHIRNYFTY